MAENKYAKYIELLNFIRNHRPDFKEIRNYWSERYDEELAIRSFHRYREHIAEIFGVEILCDKGSYRYYIEDLGEMKNSLRAWLLDSYTALNQVKADEKLAGRVIYEDVPSGSHFLQTLLEAIRENKVVSISYLKFDSEKAENRLIHPYFVRLYKRRWYVIAYSREAEDLRTYALDRIQKISIGEEKFKMPADFDTFRYFKENFGIVGAAPEVKAQEILIKAKGSARHYLESLPLHSSQIIIESGDNYSIFRFFLKPNFNFTQEILSQASQIEVLSPAEYREEIARTIKEMCEIYE